MSLPSDRSGFKRLLSRSRRDAERPFDGLRRMNLGAVTVTVGGFTGAICSGGLEVTCPTWKDCFA